MHLLPLLGSKYLTKRMDGLRDDSHYGLPFSWDYKTTHDAAFLLPRSREDWAKGSVRALRLSPPFQQFGLQPEQPKRKTCHLWGTVPSFCLWLLLNSPTWLTNALGRTAVSLSPAWQWFLQKLALPISFCTVGLENGVSPRTGSPHQWTVLFFPLTLCAFILFFSRWG